jgi:hypothetical protein
MNQKTPLGMDSKIDFWHSGGEVADNFVVDGAEVADKIVCGYEIAAQPVYSIS